MIGVVVAVLLGVATLLYWIGRRRYNYWAERGVVQPPWQFGFGHFKDAYLAKNNFGMILDEIYRSYPAADAVGVYEFLTPKLFVRSPELIQKVMVSEFSSFHDNEFYVNESLDPYFYRDPFCLRGKEWKPGRASIIPLLTHNRMRELFPLMKEVLTRLDEHIIENSSKEFEVKKLATLFTMDLISSCVFGISSNCFSDPNAYFRKMGDILLKDNLQGYWVFIFLRIPVLRDLLRIRIVPKSVTTFIEDMVSHVMEHRRKTNTIRNDLMQYLINHKPELETNELMGIAVTFFLEGFETSSMVANTAIYELALNLKIQDHLRDEIDNAFQESNDIDIDALSALPYLDKVVKETMRKHPVLYMLQRVCTEDTSLDINGKFVDIKTGTTVFIPLLSIHMNPDYYPNPEVFDPERFTEENIASRPACTYLPLGEGPRKCVGFRLGFIQVKLLLAHIVHKYRILPTDRLPARLTYDKKALLCVPYEQIFVRLEPIN